ncbi:MAG: 16S rRNA (guanine(966)-N(2))-methyltransferase RsmD, partial [Kordiimonadaceae bacterium]|nr:16S rRNA (guanine(966)-N(2))-methyltransferase RsmD [Kordiimonadaceae bacterium]MBT7732064.1 16S rRNA (guanine(966)-N(2))-methyltransferase RsmD [Rhodospirillaceae bacterium]
MRIIGGKYRSKKLIAPDNDRIRPTTDRMRETIFNIIQHGNGPGIRGSRVLDLFSGS